MDKNKSSVFLYNYESQKKGMIYFQGFFQRVFARICGLLHLALLIG